MMQGRYGPLPLQLLALHPSGSVSQRSLNLFGKQNDYIALNVSFGFPGELFMYL